MKITPVISQFKALEDRFIIKTANSHYVERFVRKMRSNPELFQRTLLGFILAKYVWKAGVYIISNTYAKDLPPDQRHFSNAMSVTNCLLQLTLVAAVGETIRKHSRKWADNLFKSLRHDPIKEELAHLGFRSFLTIAVAGAFVQKFVVTMISTPSGSWLRHRFLTQPNAPSSPQGTKEK